MVTDNLIDGAKAGGVAAGGSILLGPTIGAPIAGFAADEFLDGNYYTEAGVAVGVAMLLSRGMGGGTAGAMDTVSK